MSPRDGGARIFCPAPLALIDCCLLIVSINEGKIRGCWYPRN
ncbi:hypothetical protein [Cyanobacterium sp. uoEpiScrs1]|nr:hypothetical protein [Cyanobacterium sp. uoEpiScrs1]